MTKIKICGLKTIEDIEAVNRWKPDFAGFVFASGKRQITPGQAAELRRALDPKIQAVGVFVNAPLKEAAVLAETGVIQYIQLHGDEDAAYMEALRKQTDKPLIKAVAARSREEILEAEKLPCEYLLLTLTKKAAREEMGKLLTGRSFLPLKSPGFWQEAFSGKCGAGHKNLPAFWSGCQQRSGDTREKIQQRIREFIEKVRG